MRSATDRLARARDKRRARPWQEREAPQATYRCAVYHTGARPPKMRPPTGCRDARHVPLRGGQREPPEGAPPLCYTRAMQSQGEWKRTGQRDDPAAASPEAVIGAALEAALRDAMGDAPALLVVAVSGGMDSMVLAHALHTLWRRAGSPACPVPPFFIQLAHFDHGLRSTSAEDAQFVAEWAADNRLKLSTARWDGRATPATGSLEADARAARYAFLAHVARQAQAADPDQPQVLVLTAHHTDDQTETLLLNLLRGSGVAGLAAMRSPAPLPGAPDLQLVRPLLGVARATLQRYAEAADLRWCSDESNSDSARTRNLLRHELLPLLEAAHPGARERLLRTARLMADEADRLEAHTAAQLAPICVEQTPGVRVRLQAEPLAALPHAERRALLRHALLQSFPTHTAPDYEAADALAEATGAGHALHAHGPHPLGDGLGWTLLAARPPAAAQLSLHRLDALPLPPPGAWLDAEWRTKVGALPLPAQGVLPVGGRWLHIKTLDAARFPGRDVVAADSRWNAWLDGVGAPFTLSTPAAGARMAPMGMAGHTRTLGNLFTDAGVPPALRPGWPLILDAAGNVAWLCGMVVAQQAAVTSATTQLFYLRWETGA